jgi:hypothetical protein
MEGSMRLGLRSRAIWLALLGVVLTTAAVKAETSDVAARLNGDYAFVQPRVCSQGAPGAAGISENLVLLSPNSTSRARSRGCRRSA